MEYLVFALAFLLAAESAAFVLLWRKLDRATRELERVVSKRLSKVEKAVSEKAAEVVFRNVAIMLDGVASVSRRLERRISNLEFRDGTADQ